MKNKSYGFTLAELLVVVAVIAVLVAVAIPTYGNYIEKTRQAVDISTLRGSYTAAKLAEMEQMAGSIMFCNITQPYEINESDTYGDGVSPEKATQIIAFWYDPDAGELSMLTGLSDKAADAKSRGSTTFGHAKSSVVMIDTSGLNNKSIVYDNTSLSEVYGNSRGTESKGILVTFSRKKADGGLWTLDEIKFAGNLVAALADRMGNTGIKVGEQAYTPNELGDMFG